MLSYELQLHMQSIKSSYEIYFSLKVTFITIVMILEGDFLLLEGKMAVELDELLSHELQLYELSVSQQVQTNAILLYTYSFFTFVSFSSHFLSLARWVTSGHLVNNVDSYLILTRVCIRNQEGTYTIPDHVCNVSEHITVNIRMY